MLSAREAKALEIADKFRIVQDGHKWTVPSQSGSGKYTVRIVGGTADCTCPDHELSGGQCKHILAVRYVMERQDNPDGTTTITETITISKRETYPQNWKQYNDAQTNEQDRFQVLLHDLCKGIMTPPQVGRGQRRLPLADAVFAATFKVYSTMSGRRFISDLREAHERGFLAKLPHYNSIFNYLENPDLTPLLRDLILESSLPLKAVEENFAVDSTGFSTSKFYRWYDHKYGVEKLKHDWVKVHVMCGVKTNIVTSVEIKGRHAADYPLLKPLVEKTAENFNIAEVSADRAYCGVENARAIAKAGGTPFIAFRSNSVGAGQKNVGLAYRDMYHYFSFRRDDFMRHYHKRSNVETTFSMMKRKFGDSIRSKTDTAMTNEVLCKILCHNIVVLIHEIFELGIEPSFRWAEIKSAQQNRLDASC